MTDAVLITNSRVSKYYPVPLVTNLTETSFDYIFVDIAETTKVSFQRADRFSHSAK